MKKTLLIGDSIRMGYCGFVKALLAGEAEVFFPEENGRRVGRISVVASSALW